MLQIPSPPLLQSLPPLSVSFPSPPSYQPSRFSSPLPSILSLTVTLLQVKANPIIALKSFQTSMEQVLAREYWVERDSENVCEFLRK